MTTDHQPGDDGISFTPSGETLAVAYQGPWDEATGTFLDHDGDPAVERFEVPGGRLVGSLSGPPGSYQSLAPRREWPLAGRGPRRSRRAPSRSSCGTSPPDGPPRSLGPGSALPLPPRDRLRSSSSEVEGTGLAVVDVATGDLLREIETPDDVQYFGLEIDPSGRPGRVGVAYRPHGSTCSILTNGALESRLQMPTPTVAKFSADGHVLAVGGNDNLIRLFDTATFTETQRLAGMPDGLYGWRSRPTDHVSCPPPPGRSGPGISRRKVPRRWATSTWRGASRGGSSSRPTSRRHW